MPIGETTTFEVSSQGPVEDREVERAKERIGRVGSHCREVITHVELRITDDVTHPDQQHARAEATLVVKHGPVRAHAHAATVGEAIDLMVERLRRRVDRHESKLHRVGDKRRDGVAREGSWHHGDVESSPRRPLPRPEDTAVVVRRKTFAAAPMSVEEALFDLDILDHDFYLFEEVESGQVCLVSHTDDGRYELAADDAAVLGISGEVTTTQGPAVLDRASAQRLLTTTDEPFIFHRTSPDDPAQVLYRRYDGDFGIVELGESARSSVSSVR